jgi:AAA+ ATPase superfamily predicted ATPase
MNNPFRYGIAVDDPHFIDREQEMSDFAKWLKSGQSLVVYSPRRYGKTSLILKILKNLRDEGYNTVYIDFFKVSSRRRFAELYYAEIMKQMPSWEKALKKIAGLTKRVRPVVSLDNQGLPNISVKFENGAENEDLTEVFDLPQRLAEHKPWVVVFDEFQDITRLNGESFERELRASIIHHSKVSYVFMGSRMHILLNIFTHRNRAFYQFGKLYELKKIPADILANYLRKRFHSTGIKFEAAIFNQIIETCDAIPHYVQYLASGAWEEAQESNGILDQVILNKAINKIVMNQNDYFMNQYERLTAHQQRVLLAVCEESKNIYTSEFAERFHLNPVSSTQRSIQRLLKDGILSKNADSYNFNDPFFRLWLIKTIS